MNFIFALIVAFLMLSYLHEKKENPDSAMRQILEHCTLDMYDYEDQMAYFACDDAFPAVQVRVNADELIAARKKMKEDR